jgi:hypothetical protein
LLIALVLMLAMPASAHAAWIPATPIDGPNGDVVSLGNVDIARDGAGAVAYLRRVDGVPHAFISRMFGGIWRSPEQVDGGLGPATEVRVAVGDNNRVAVAWISGGTVYANVAPGGPTAPSGFTGPVAIGGPGARSLDIDLGINDAAYAVWEQGGDVRAARLQDATWTAVAAPLDIDPGLEAGTGALRPKVAVSAEGYAVATWGDRPGDGTTRIWGRRITGLNLSAFPQVIAGGGLADSPDIDIEDDGSFAWVVYRQDLGGVSRTFGRRLVGSLFEAPEAIDAGQSSDEPRVDMSSRGIGYAAAQMARGPQVVASQLLDDHFQPAGRFDTADSADRTAPDVAATDSNDVAIAWRTNGTTRARFKDVETPFGPEFTISRPEFGAVADPGVSISGDRVGDMAVAMVQGTADGLRTLSVGHYDRQPPAPATPAYRYRRETQPQLRWNPGLELWGTPVHRVYIDGVLVGETTRDTFTPATPLTAGRHRWQVETVDRAGQSSRSRLRTLRIDPLAPKIRLAIRGSRKAGRSLLIRVRATDTGGSGIDHITVDYGDRSKKSHSKSTRHRYRRGSFTLKIAAVDRAGNVARRQVRLRIKA